MTPANPQAKVIFRGGPFDGRSASRPEQDEIAVRTHDDEEHVHRAFYRREGDEYHFLRCDRARCLVGGPHDGGEVLDKEPGDHDGVLYAVGGHSYAWYAWAGRGTYRFDGYVNDVDLEVVARETPLQGLQSAEGPDGKEGRPPE